MAFLFQSFALPIPPSMPLSVSLAAYEALHDDLLDAWKFTSLGDMFSSPSRSESWHFRLNSVGYAILAGEDFYRDEHIHSALLRLVQVLITRLELCWPTLTPTPLISYIERTLVTVGPDGAPGALGLYRRELEPFVTSPFRTLGYSVHLACSTLPKMSAPFFWTRDFRDLRFTTIFDAKRRARWLRFVLEAMPSELHRQDVNISKQDWIRAAGRLKVVADFLTREIPRYRLPEHLRSILEAVTRRAADKGEPVRVVFANRTSRFVRSRGRGRPHPPASRRVPSVQVPSDTTLEEVDAEAFDDSSPAEWLLHDGPSISRLPSALLSDLDL
ncbi:hypothetical protein CVT24_010688 [Panaeolus cyanescens]|uniref:Uncharacterized protein n=1 Tax=Panaeolus cyanescens TaxID=181874 RepID=A0A409WEA5_9AGAR|nr:hypothetical protein CVT24_010688 [Panaeolus cyanescens]